MMYKKAVIFLLFILPAGIVKADEPMRSGQERSLPIVANPMNLNYRFQSGTPAYREAADPVCEYFKGQYYLFASKSGGYWRSADLAEWEFIPCSTIREIENYAPGILVRNDSMYYIASGSKIYRTDNPDADRWEEIHTKFTLGVTDPSFFQDDDGRVYLYWGCSDKAPVEGVEVNPDDGFAPLGNRLSLIPHNSEQYGWEVQGENNDNGQTGWNEGPCMIKYNGKYYLQYASPGTQFRSYADGVYVSDHPLGPFIYQEYSPFSIKPGGFIGGAGHGHTFKDKYGNYWHIATMKISERHMFERRLGLFPLYFDEDGEMYAPAVWSDYPWTVPDKKTDFEPDSDGALRWNLLSYNKPVTASSSCAGFLPSKANDEKIETWWAAQTGDAGEWWQVDLTRPMAIHAIQVNFADQDFINPAPAVYRYQIEASADGEHWNLLIDRRQNVQDMPHELIVPDRPATVRFLRITSAQNLRGKFSISGFRVFGRDQEGQCPNEVSRLQVERQHPDTRRFLVQWDKQENTTGYIVRWGISENKLNHAVMVFDNRWEAGCFNRHSSYYFSVGAFNESGITRGKTVAGAF
ncbi:MAG: family 43 glycosylhydrolase [Dysgonamonadaceae bacterium]|jgi:hypothetical protein|nr:family 43 glycosylhydrolase [Dysgonamonadaceae bacterium]